MASDRRPALSWPLFRHRPRAARRPGRVPTPIPPAAPEPSPSPRTATAPPSRFHRVALNTTNRTREGYPLPRRVFPTSRASATRRILHNHHECRDPGLKRDYHSPHAGQRSTAPSVQITGPRPLAGEQVTGLPVRGYDLNPVTLGSGLHGLRWHPPEAPTVDRAHG